MTSTIERPAAGQHGTDGPIRIDAAPGRVVVTAPNIFREAGDAPFQSLVQRLATTPFIRSIDLDRELGRVFIVLDCRETTLAAAMATMAQAISRTAAADCAKTDLVFAGNAPSVQRRQGESKDGAKTQPELLIGESRRLDILPAGSQPGVIVVRQAVSTEHMMVARGLRRFVNLAAAGSCLMMSCVGLVTPGIPTVPFVLATSYFLVRSSPALDARLKRSRLFGPMLRDWEAYGGMRSGDQD